MPSSPVWRPLFVLVLLLLCSPLTARDARVSSPPAAGRDLLADHRWQEGGYGLSIRPPRHARLQPGGGGKVAARFITDRLGLTISIRHSETPVDSGLIRKRAVSQFAFLYPSARQVRDEQPDIQPAGQPGAKLYFVVPDQEEGDWISGQAFIMISPKIIGMLRMQADATDFEHARRVFEQVVRSIRLADPKQLKARRRARLEAGQEWLKQLGPDVLSRKVGTTRWLRVLKGGKDIGYMRMSVKKGSELGQPGVRVRVQSRLYTGESAYDTLSTFFRGKDGQTGLWSIHTTRRSDQPGQAGGLPSDQPGKKKPNWIDTGIRADGRISVSRETPTDTDHQRWQVPPLGYLSQVQLMLLRSALPANQSRTLAFYTYSPDLGRLSLRTMRLRPRPDGGVHVIERAAPDQPPQESVYGPAGRLLRRRLPDGRILRPTTVDRIRRIWNR